MNRRKFLKTLGMGISVGPAALLGLMKLHKKPKPIHVRMEQGQSWNDWRYFTDKANHPVCHVTPNGCWIEAPAAEDLDKGDPVYIGDDGMAH